MKQVGGLATCALTQGQAGQTVPASCSAATANLCDSHRVEMNWTICQTGIVQEVEVAGTGRAVHSTDAREATRWAGPTAVGAQIEKGIVGTLIWREACPGCSVKYVVRRCSLGVAGTAG